MKLTENIDKPRELWKSLTSLGLKFESSISSISCLDKKKSANFDVKEILAKILASIFQI